MDKNQDRNQQFAEKKEQYQQIEIPKELKKQVEEAVTRGKKDKALRGRRRIITRIGVGVAAALAIFITLPNINGDIAYAMAKTPVIGTIAKAVTFREYQYDSDRYQADVKVPQVVTEDGSETADIKNINLDIDEITQEAIAEFKESSQMEEGYEDLVINHETVTDNEDYLTLKLVVYIGAGSGSETDYFYTVSKHTGERVYLSDVCKKDSDYITAISENIKKQMHEQMEQDEMVTYFVDSDEVPEWNFKQIDEDADFYFNQAGNLVIAFDEYEVAPGSMGTVEFEIPNQTTKKLLN